MNVFFALGDWWESRRVLRKSDLETVQLNYKNQGELTADLFRQMQAKIDALKDSNHIPQTIAKEFALLNARLDRLELLTGLKREAEPTHVKGAPRIE